jgi:uncharacterized protein (TIGR02270 family)
VHRPRGGAARRAARGGSAITGLDLASAGLTEPRPAPREEDEPPLFEDEDLDAALVPRAEERLPAPDAPGLIRWWNQNRGRFDPDVRYLGGRPTTLRLLVDALADGPMRRRRPVALELAVRTRGQLQIETRAFIAEQRRRLTSFDGHRDTKLLACARR